MQPEQSRYINSVSDLLLSTDEIEFLLEDIRDLEPTSCKPEDIQVADGMSSVLQDFEIAGSRTGALSSADCAGGCDCDSPLDTVNSWDSHSHYRQRAASPDISLYSGVIVYCDHTHLKTPTGFLRVILLATTIACLACLCSSGTMKVGLFMLPSVGRIRFMMFVSLLSILATCLLLFLDISHIIYLFPFNWGKLNAYFYVSLSVLFLIASSLIFHSIFLSEAFSWVPKWTHEHLLVTGCLGYVCCLESVLLALIQKRSKGPYEPVAEDPSMNLQERQTSLQSSPFHRSNQVSHNYKPMMNHPSIGPSTSRQETYYFEDVQPCSSKTGTHYRTAS
ncbi:uncharacterized protein LOC123308222 isoform X1 [Coccinella septempunctata]|uniref:uncharacterized protein LOC123308222 isoform X1 n=1 Tax=Coccinella septempunctata TaxID=41139 RepID=UPI001D081221|nr:uncharacterized protein LOC123308222 isoform X1 [Coccinella septempunctata]